MLHARKALFGFILLCTLAYGCAPKSNAGEIEVLLQRGLPESRHAAYSLGPDESLDYPLRRQLIAHPALAESLLQMAAEPLEWSEALFLLDLASSLHTSSARKVVLCYVRRQHVSSPALSRALDKAYPEGEEDMLLAEMAHTTAEIFFTCCAFLKQRGFLTRQAAEQIASTLDDRVSDMQSLLYLLREFEWYAQFLKQQYASLERVSTKMMLLDAICDMHHTDSWVPEWLLHISLDEQEPAIHQHALYLLHMLGMPGAAERLMLHIESNGVEQLSASRWNWSSFREFVQHYPDGYLARGVRQYEQATQRPYFGIDRLDDHGFWYETYGDAKYEPEREIERLQDWLDEFDSHPGSDDAAYRLARNYECIGDYSNALVWLYRATTLPDGDMKYHAQGRLCYLMDARINLQRLLQMSHDGDLSPALKTAIDYSSAVRLAREAEFDEALRLLYQVLDTRPALKTLLVADCGYPIWASIESQVKVFEQIRALLAHGASDDDLYAAAALVFGDELVFYNHLWAGNRQVFFWTGYLKHHFYGEAEDYLEEYIRGFNNYAQAYRMFSSVAESAPPDIRERALFSMGRCLVALDEYAEEVYLAYSPAALRNEIIDLFSRFRDEYPSSQMADDALLTAGIYSQDTTFFETILEHYPKSDSAPEAKRRLKTAKSIRNSVTPVPFLLITDMQDLPLLVRERSESGEQVITHAGYAYVVEPLVEMGRVFSVWVDAVNHTITLFTDGNAGAGESTAVRFISPGAGFILRIDP